MDINSQDMKKMADIAKKMQGKPQDDIIDEIVAMIKSGQSGLTPEKALQMIKVIAPMMDAKQRNTLDKLAKELSK